MSLFLFVVVFVCLFVLNFFFGGGGGGLFLVVLYLTRRIAYIVSHAVC